MTQTDQHMDIPQPQFSPADIARMLGSAFAPTPEQAAVIGAPPGPLLVVAGAGAGKTETMAARVVWLVANGYATPAQILGLTFTRKAAGQLGQRIRQRLHKLAKSPEFQGPAAERIRELIRVEDPDVKTYDSYAGALLRNYGLLIPVETSVTLASEGELVGLMENILLGWKSPLTTDSHPTRVAERVVQLHGEMANHQLTTDDLRQEDKALGQLLEELPRSSRARSEFSQEMVKFQELCHHRQELVDLVDLLDDRMCEEGLLDFGSQMAHAATLALHRPTVGETERTLHRVVMLDEYQDTGHAQRMLLAGLYGGAQDPHLTVTAVGDPMQSIYGWRSASAANLDLFRTDYPLADGADAPTSFLTTSWRNPAKVLSLANYITQPLRNSTAPNALRVPELQPKPGAQDAHVDLGFFETVDAEYDAMAQAFAAEFEDAAERGVHPPRSAILVSRNADSFPIYQALQRHNVPAFIANVGGLLFVPEVQEVWNMLRILGNPLDGEAALRVVTSPRINLGAKDIDALWRRASVLRRELQPSSTGGDGLVDTPEKLVEELRQALNHDEAADAGLIDAVDNPGDAAHYSPRGYKRIQQLQRELRHLRKKITDPIPELVAEVERTIGLNVEMEACIDPALDKRTGRIHLDAFADYATAYMNRNGRGLGGFLEYLQAAADHEQGLPSGDVRQRPHCVQILTVYGAKGLEWECVAIPCLSKGIFPPGKARSYWMTNAASVPVSLRGDVERVTPSGRALPGVPGFHPEAAETRSDFMNVIKEHKKDLREMELRENRRLMYVAVTRTERRLWLSGHAWQPGRKTPFAPSTYLDEARAWVEKSLAPVNLLSWHQNADTVAAATAEELAGGADVHTPFLNPLEAEPQVSSWPRDALAERPYVRAAHAALLAEIAAQEAVEADDAGRDSSNVTRAGECDPWPDDALHEDVSLLLAEFMAAHASTSGEPCTVVLPTRLTASQIVALQQDPEEFARRLRRPVPYLPHRYARRGTEFHAWVEHHLATTTTALLDWDDLELNADYTPEPSSLTRLKEQFEKSVWASRTAYAVELPFDVSLGRNILNGRIDAIFQDDDEHFSVVDWKTGAPPRSERDRRTKALQLAVYRLAFARIINAQRTQAGLSELPLENIRAAFHYVGHNQTLWLTDLATAEELTQVIDTLSNSTHLQ